MTESRRITIDSIIREDLLPGYSGILRIVNKQHGVQAISRTDFEQMRDGEIDQSEIFNRLAWNRGKGKPHAMKHYPNDEGKPKRS